MEQQPRSLCRVVAFVALVFCPIASRADDELDPLPPDAAKNPGMVTEAYIVDQLVFQELLRVPGTRILPNALATTALDQIDSQLRDILDEVERFCQLSDVQKQKLALSGRGDIRRFFDQVAELRRKFPSNEIDQQHLEKLFPHTNPLQEQFTRGLFREESLFAKTLRKTLTEEQQARYQAALLDRRRAAYGTAVDKVLEKYQDFISREQLQGLKQLLVERTEPPLVYGEHDHRVVMLRIGELPRTELKKLFNKTELRFLRAQWLDASGFEDYLARQGAIEPKEQAAPVILRSVRRVVESAPE